MSQPNSQQHHLNKMSMESLIELQHRHKELLKNTRVIGNLADKGSRLKEKLEIVTREILLRENMKELETGLEKLSVTDSQTSEDKHTLSIYKIEKEPDKERYKPFSSLVAHKTLSNTTQLIKLDESLSLLKMQAEKVEEAHFNLLPLNEEPVEEET